jgi:hypothetical protein
MSVLNLELAKLLQNRKMGGHIPTDCKSIDAANQLLDLSCWWSRWRANFWCWAVCLSATKGHCSPSFNVSLSLRHPITTIATITQPRRQNWVVCVRKVCSDAKRVWLYICPYEQGRPKEKIQQVLPGRGCLHPARRTGI